MKISDAWAELRLQEAQFKLLSFLVAIVAAISIVLNLTLSQRQPLVIDRNCETEIAKIGNSEPSISEIKGFLTKALAQRFNTGEPSTNFLSDQQKAFKLKELEEIKTRNIRQIVIVQNIDIKNDNAIVDLDRIVAIGTIKSALNFIVQTKFARVPRSAENPYGLLLIETTKAPPGVSTSSNSTQTEAK